MKKLIIVTFLFLSVCIVQAQSFYTVGAEVVQSSIVAYTKTVADTAVVDSTSMLINCWFGEVGNPYIDTVSRAWCQFVQISATIKGNASTSDYINSASRFADAYRQRVYPDIR